jgi:hypothetical protein
MAAPHLVLAVLAFAPRWRGAGLLLGLVVLDVVLTAFWLWVRLGVPAHESALAWVLYLPVAGVAMLLLAGAPSPCERGARTTRRAPDAQRNRLDRGHLGPPKTAGPAGLP